MSEQREGDPTGWHCVREPMTWPGCGECLFCKHGSAQIFRAARRLRQENERMASALVCIDHELRLEGR